MVKSLPFRVRVLPTASGEELNLRAHRPALIIRMGGAPNSSSPEVKVRPMTGCTPSKEKKSEEISFAWTCSAGPRPVRLKP